MRDSTIATVVRTEVNQKDFDACAVGAVPMTNISHAAVATGKRFDGRALFRILRRASR
ncbi:MAG: hypothetical protein AAF493_30305 [Pseudomonadota bacterium]